MNEDSTITEAKTRKEREYERHRLEILDAAERVFVRNGKGASMASIAAEAQVSVGSVYNFYENKDELFRSVLIKIADERVEKAAEALENGGGDVWAVMKRLVRWWIEHHIDHGDFLLFSMALAIENGVGKVRAEDAGIVLEMKMRARRYYDTLLPFFARVAADGGCAVDRSDTLMMFEGYMRSLLFNATHNEPSFEIDALTGRACKFLRKIFGK